MANSPERNVTFARLPGGLGWRFRWDLCEIAIDTQDAKAMSNFCHQPDKIPFVPDDFDVPIRLEHKRFLLRPLCVTDVVKDYEAVITSIDHVQGVFGPSVNWPSDLTFEQDLIDVAWHHKEFQMRDSFTYTVMNRDESECLGSTYILPTLRKNFDAEAYCWIRASEIPNGLDKALYDAVVAWLRSDWPFRDIAWPGRNHSWN